MGSKSQTSTTNQNSTYTPTALAQLQSIYGQAASAASQPYTAYTGELTAPLTQTQQNAITGANSAANIAQPYYTQAGQLASSASTPLTASQIQQYQSPYTQQVVDATQAQFNQSNAEQQNQLKGNAAIAGALGGDRQAVAQAQLAGQQQTAQAPVIANLYNTGYNNALTTAQQQFQTNPLAAASALGNIGSGAQTAAEQGVQGQLTAGGTEQSTNQLADTNNYQQFLQQLAYPYQNAQFLASIGLPAATAMGGTTTGQGTSTSPGPNTWTQALGLGLSAASLFSDEKVKDNIEKIGKSFDGQNIYRFNYKGDPTTRIGFIAQEVEGKHPSSVTTIDGIKGVDYHDATDAAAKKGHFASGGSVGLSPFDFINGVSGYVPKATSISGGSAHQPSLNLSTPSSSANSNSMQPVISGLSGLKGSLGGESYGGGNIFTDAYGGSSSNPLEGLTAADYGPGYADGGEVSFGDRFAPAVDNPFGDMDRGQAVAILSDLNGGITAPASIGGDDTTDVANPTDPIVIDPASTDQWRASVDQMQPNLLADNGGGASVPTTPALPPQITGPQRAPVLPSDALAYSGTDQPMASTITAPVQSAGATPNAGYEMGGWNPFNLSDKARQAIIAGGLGMAASRSPFALSAIGEGGLYGLKTLGDLNKAEQEAAQKKLETQQTQQRIDQEAERIRNQATQFATTSTETHRHNVASEDKDSTPTGYRKTTSGDYEPIPGGPADPTQIKAISEAKRVANAVLDDDTIHDMAAQYLAGDRTVMQNLGRGAQGAENIVKLRQAIAKQARDAGIDPAGIVNTFNEQAGKLAGQRTVGARAANISLAANEANNMIPIALAASDKLPRSQFMPWNQMVQSVQKGTSSPELASFVAATNSLVNSYVRAVSPSGVPTDAMRQHAYDMLNSAQGPEAYKAVIATMQQEMRAALQAPGQVRKELRKGNEPADAPAGATVQPTTPKRVRQNGHTYELGSDGQYHPVQ